MRRLSLSLDALPALRESTGGAHIDLSAASSLAELAGVDALRLGLEEALRPVDETDAHSLRRSAHALEIRMPPAAALLKTALDVRPDAVFLSAEAWEGTIAGRPLEPRNAPSGLASVIRSLEEAGIVVGMVVAPTLDAVREVHRLGLSSVELYTGSTVDLPASERRPRLEELADAAKLAAKLRMTVSVGGGLDYRSVTEILRASASIQGVSIGRALIARALLVGIDRAARDFIALVR